MLKPVRTKKFDKSIELCRKRGFDMELIKEVIRLLVEEKPLSTFHHPHKLCGKYAKHKECHIQPDWLLIYRYDSLNREIIFEDTGTHSDLF